MPTPRVLPPPASATEALAAISDSSGLLDVAERLCAAQSPAVQWALGLQAAQRALADRSTHPRSNIATARCAALLADWEPDPARLIALAEEGIAAASSAPDNPHAAYFGALCLGIKLRQQGIAALASLGEVVEMLTVAQAAAATDLGGPIRVLGALYLRAPPWPGGPGDLDRALELLAEASKRYPSHPANHLFYAQALRENEQFNEAADELRHAEALAAPEIWGDYAARWRAEIAAERETR